MKILLRPVVVALTVVAVGSVGAWELAERSSSLNEPEVVLTQMISSLPKASAAGGLWFCPFAGDTNRQGTVVVSADRQVDTDRPLSLKVTAYNSTGEVASRAFSISAASQLLSFQDLGIVVPKKSDSADSDSSDSGTEPATNQVDSRGGGYALTVESSDPTALIELNIETAGGSFRSPCSTKLAASQWFPSGSAALGSDTELALFNPFPESAVVDLDFLSERGPASPSVLQGLVVNGNSVRVINVGRLLRYREQVATHVKVRSGRIVSLERLVTPAGTTVQMPAPESAKQWFFPAARLPESGQEKYLVSNPSDEEVTVEFRAAFSSTDAEPFELVVAPQSVSALDVGADGRITKNQAYAMSASVVDGPAVVITRETHVSTGARKGLTAAVGAPVWSSYWATSASSSETVLTVHNPFEVATSFSVSSVSASGKRDEKSPINLGPDSWAQIVLPPAPVANPAAAIRVTSQPYGVVVSVERQSTNVRAAAIAVPQQ